MEHDFYTAADFQDDCDSYLYRIVVDGGLGVCKTCGLYEGSLTTECPSVKSYQYADDVYAGKIDFVEGEWKVGRKNPTNQWWDAVRRIADES